MDQVEAGEGRRLRAVVMMAQIAEESERHIGASVTEVPLVERRCHIGGADHAPDASALHEASTEDGGAAPECFDRSTQAIDVEVAGE